MGGADYLDSRDRGWVRNSAGHWETKAYLEKLADRLAVLIGKSDDPRMAMHEIARAAERGGLIDCDNLPSQSSPAQFVADLFLESMVAHDWMNARLSFMPGHMKHPRHFTEVGDVAEHLL